MALYDRMIDRRLLTLKSNLGGMRMNFSELLQMYEHQKQHQTSDGHELLTLTKKLYISNEISLQNYKELITQINRIGSRAVPTL
jgi:hypothetical protein